MFEVIMRLKEGISREELYKDTANAPNIARKAPSHIEYDFGRAVMPGRDNR